MLDKGIISVCCEKHTKLRQTRCRKM